MQVYAPGARIAGRYEVTGRPMLGGMDTVYQSGNRRDMISGSRTSQLGELAD